MNKQNMLTLHRILNGYLSIVGIFASPDTEEPVMTNSLLKLLKKIPHENSRNGGLSSFSDAKQKGHACIQR